MKRFAKICLIVCGCCVVLGMLLLGIGTAMGARPEEYLNLAHINGWGFHMENQEKREDMNERSHHQDHEWEHSGSWEAAEGEYEYDETFDEEIRELEISVSYGTIYLQASEQGEVRVLAQDTSKAFQCWMDGRKLKIEDEKKNRNDGLELVILLPQNQLDELEMELGAGYLEARELKAKKINLEMGAGECTIGRMEAEEKADLYAGAGNIRVEEFQGKKLEGGCGAGELDLYLDGVYEDYNYEISSAMGEIVLGDSQYTGLGFEKHISNKASQDVELDCGIGNIFVSFCGEP